MTEAAGGKDKAAFGWLVSGWRGREKEEGNLERKYQ